MRIGELARRTGLSVSRIRFYEAQGLISPPSRERNGYRSYADGAVARLVFIDRARLLGFSLAEIGGELPDARSLPDPQAIVSALIEKQLDLDRIIADAQARKRSIAALVEELSCAL
ncbi:transcriptional regulator, MerR family [Devosia lucknowensis]|uniref:Transcriptional regulator, MerR family n=1 Tax=Devosia lucknowensis TaxID=1096929 RepID=A0A1Y6ED44_9HYPH|nr:MerR family transcriptional regulator [Devosia lucknowensis]SMQ58542.1 transcriptional regulator, MerR family [Devosia lucknowensis]